jgi:hypothetical protein
MAVLQSRDYDPRRQNAQDREPKVDTNADKVVRTTF